ncbi:hypothetical protein BGZ98_000283 [Dissophora globulifera]|nr:hypothetical protein BGZ98_000283 [Dissophora globulifera]
MASASETPNETVSQDVRSSNGTPDASSAIQQQQHIFKVAAQSLQDCVELLQSLKHVIAQEEVDELEDSNKDILQTATNGSADPHTVTNGTNGHTVCNVDHPSQRPQKVEGVSNGDKDIKHNGDGHDHGDTTSATHHRLPSDTSVLPHAITPCRRSEIYTKPSALACQGTIGKHVRHLHDHFRLLLSTYPPSKGLPADQEWCVDYDQRSREVPMETDIDFAISEMKRLRVILEQCQHSENTKEQQHPLSSDLSRTVTLRATVDPLHPPISFQTTFGRELWFCSLHAVHHFAMIKVICGEFGMPLTEGFGLAPSTLKNRHKH